MLNCVFLIPIDHRGIQGQCFGQYLELQTWCDKNNAAILTCNGLFLNFARNFLATGGGGFADTSPPKAEWLFWIDSDVRFNMEQIEYMLSLPQDKKFVTGWYRSDYSDKAMVGNWNEDYFKENLHMPFTSVKWLEETADKDPNKLVQVDWCGFGFTKVHRSIYEEMDYPYYPLRDAHIPDCRHPHKEGERFTVDDLSFEDVSFCRNVYDKLQIKPLVVPQLRVGHLKSFFV
mgnify:FL=1|tara:strand:+ start:4270 stop:4962 length:693 start_codon:yes stop_codon:yes gene_type:complete